MRRMRNGPHSRVLIAACGVAALLSTGCEGDAPGDGRGASVVGSESKGLYEANWIDRFQWDAKLRQYVVAVCFQSPGEENVKRKIRQALRAEWGAKSGLHFTFGECPDHVPSDSVPIRFKYDPSDNGWGGVSAYGRGGRLLGTPDAEIEIRLTPNRRMLASTAVHEMGHTLGFIHEHERPDRPTPNCVTGTDADFVSSDGRYATIYDPASLMNYCRDLDGNGVVDIDEARNPEAMDSATLSRLDVIGVQRIYGANEGNFAPGKWIGSAICLPGELCETGDVDGDGVAEAVIFARKRGDVFVARLESDGTFGPRKKWHGYFCVGNEVCKTADVNGDGKDDIVAFTRGGAGDVYVSLSDGHRFNMTGSLWHDYFCVSNETCDVADVNGDGRADLVAFTRNSAADVWVSLGQGYTFGPSRRWTRGFCSGLKTCTTGDVNGDGRADIVAFTKSTESGAAAGDVHVALSTGLAFGSSKRWHEWMCIGRESCRIADVNGDGRDDAVAFTRGGDAWVALGGASRFDFGPSSIWGDWHCVGAETCQMADLNGDGTQDLVAFDRKNKSVWSGLARRGR